MQRAVFRRLVSEAPEDLPAEFLVRMNNGIGKSPGAGKCGAADQRGSRLDVVGGSAKLHVRA